jgi:outer membrane protein assembly factor BamB
MAFTDVLVIRYDSGGQQIWSTTIDSGGLGYATSIIETSDGGYAIAGGIADDPRALVYPRILKLDMDGVVLWDRTVGSSPDEAVDIVQSQDGGYTAGTKYGLVQHHDVDGIPVWNRTFNHSI